MIFGAHAFDNALNNIIDSHVVLVVKDINSSGGTPHKIVRGSTAMYI